MIDFGEKSVGLAVSDIDQTMVFGRGVIRNFKNLAGLFAQIKVFCDSENVIEVIMGVPVDENGEDTPQSARIRAFGAKLEEHLKPVPVMFEDESFTSFEASQLLAEAGIKGSRRKESEDEMAAVLILKRYLDLEE